MANNNNNNKSKTGGFSAIKNKIDEENNKKNEGNMATSNSIIKKTEYWLPDELWGQVKDFMGLCKKEDKVNWELIKKVKKEDLFYIGLPRYNITFNRQPRPLIEIGPSGVPSLVDKDGNKLKPAEMYFKTLKNIYMRNRLMTPAKWKKLSAYMTKKYLKGFDRAKVGDKFKYKCHRAIGGLGPRTISLLQDSEHEVIEKKKTIITIKFTGYEGVINFSDDDLPPPQELIIKIKKGDFNSLNIYRDTKML